MIMSCMGVDDIKIIEILLFCWEINLELIYLSCLLNGCRQFADEVEAGLHRLVDRGILALRFACSDILNLFSVYHRHTVY